MEFVLPLFFLILAAVLGGLAAKAVKLPPLVGYILGGLVFGTILPPGVKNIARLSEVGTILLLFSIGVELSLTQLSRFFKIATLGALTQIILVSAISFYFLRSFGLAPVTSLILGAGFSLSSTAVVLKILSDRGELDTIHGNIMFGWLLVQDLAVVPMMIILPILGKGGGLPALILFSLFKALLVVVGAVAIGRLVVPYLIHKVAEANSRELLILSSVTLALGTAALTSFLGISPSLGAFLAGVVISESQEHHAVFAEVRPLRDLFVALFFVSLGFLISPAVIFSKFGLILTLLICVLVLKFLVVFSVSCFLGYRGKTAVSSGLGLAQVGEFAFVIYSTSLGLKLIGQSDASIGIAVTLATLIISPFLFRATLPFWRFLKAKTKKFPALAKLFVSGQKKFFAEAGFKNHIIICGYGRVGSWVGKALTDQKVPFVVVEYNQKIVGELKEKNIPVIYGDPTEPELLNQVDIKEAKAVILAIPDRVTQENLIAYVQTVAPSVKIISRAHLEEDWEILKTLRVDKVVQPEFEAAVAIIKSIFSSMGKSKEDISAAVKALRVSHSR